VIALAECDYNKWKKERVKLMKPTKPMKDFNNILMLYGMCTLYNAYVCYCRAFNSCELIEHIAAVYIITTIHTFHYTLMSPLHVLQPP
jgi:hypothetical protein